ncbi:MAG: hypothetical protein JXA87_02870 [Thermoleophilia bacterium]|nr:hypothetical protein [Thermoleophilia bacterium]
MTAFKIKRWAPLRTVAMADFIPGFKSYQTPGGAGIVTKGWSVPFRGQIVVAGYAADDTPTWAVYHPASHTISGPYTASFAWAYDSAYHGWNTAIVVWRDEQLLGVPMDAGYYYGRNLYYGWDSGFTLCSNFYAGDRNRGYMSDAGLGFDGVDPCMLSRQWKYESGDYSNYALVKHTLAGATVDYAGSPVYFDTTWGSTNFSMKKLGPYYQWKHDDGNALYSHVPASEDDPYIMLGTFGANFTAHSVASKGLCPYPDGSNTIIRAVPAAGDQYWAAATAPLIPIEQPWLSNWHYRALQDGGYVLDEYDVDGIDHGISATGPGSMPPSFNSELGWYVGLTSFESPTSFTIYVLDPRQPSSRAFVSRGSFSAPAAWVGEYAIGDNLAVEHVLPFPDDRDPSGSSVQPPQVRTDGYALGSKEVFRFSAAGFSYVRNVKVDLSSYPTDDEDWWWPGQEGDYYDAMLELFAGNGPTVVGRMPDPDWGWLSPVGSQVAWGLGRPIENLKAIDPAPTHTLKNSQRISNTNFATMLPGSLSNLRRQLRACPGDDRFTYIESGTRAGSPPAWNAVVGRITGSTWTTLIDFEDLGPPGLGETGWTVWSVAPVPRCRPLPEGGFLVGATLYFDPWETWEWDPGERTATFKYKDGSDSGQGCVPAKAGYIGPLPIDHHTPVLLTGYDEWTFGRSLYGPDALLIYDNEGVLIECLNSPDLYPPDGREIVVVPGGVPRVIFRIYRHGTYSDNAEGWGQYHGGGEYDVQAPLYACYDLERRGEILPGAGAFKGFIEMYRVRDYSPKDAEWRWETCCPSIYDWQYPRRQWSPPGGAYVREGLGGGGITILSPGPGQGRSGVKGVGRRA